jgi:lauroyl/myristoyl acyltransferase
VARGGRALRSRSRAVLLGYQLGSRLAPLLPRRAAYRFADLVGDIAWLLNRPGRHAVRQNLSHVLGRQPPWRLVRQVFRHGTRNYYDTFLIPNLSSAEILELVRVQNWSDLDRALQAGHGAIMVGVHLSSVALAGQVIAARGHDVTTVVERVEPPDLFELLVRLRSGGGLRVLPLGSDLMRQLIAVLRRNGVVALVMDRDIAGTGVEVDFFGAPASLPSGAALLSLRTGAPILSAVAVRASDDRFDGQIDSPIVVERGSSVAESVKRTTRLIASRFERHIRAHPEQWTVFQPLWSGRSEEQHTVGSV